MSGTNTPGAASPETMHDFEPPFLRLEPGDVIDIRCANAACHEFLRVTLLPNWWLHIPAYHSRHCKRVARKHLEAQEVFTGCPHPLKATFRTEHEAREAAQTMTKGQALPVRPYRCTCGALHIGHAQFKIVSRAAATPGAPASPGGPNPPGAPAVIDPPHFTQIGVLS